MQNNNTAKKDEFLNLLIAEHNDDFVIEEQSHGTFEEAEHKKVVKKFKIKDIVFLAILSAITLLGCGVMPLVIPLQPTIFGIAQLVTALQLSVFPAIAIMKVRKIGSLLFISLFTGIIQLLMSPAMFVNNIIIGVFLEFVVAVVFKGYKSNVAVFTAVALYNPLSLPFNYVYNSIIGNEIMTAVAEKAPWLTVVMTLSVLVVSVTGTLVGIRIAKELKKAGVLKK